MKIKLDICCGTACYLLGAEKIMAIESELPQQWRDKIEVQAWPCLNLCMQENLEGAPFVKIDGEIIAKATPEKIMDHIRAKLEEDDHA